MRTPIEALRLLVGSNTTYAVRLASSTDEMRAAQSLRFSVFNLELEEGLRESFRTGLDADAFDEVCDHLLVYHLPTGDVVGTYRLQTGRTAAARLGYYSQQEFDFEPFEERRGEIVELGRACVHRLHRNMIVLGLLWKGIADYAADHQARFLCGCSSITSQDPAIGAAVYTELCRRKHLAPPEWRTKPWPAWECPLDQLAPEPTKMPKLLRAYLNIGARICAAPALDRSFGTIDFLTLVDLTGMPPSVRNRYTA